MPNNRPLLSIGGGVIFWMTLVDNIDRYGLAAQFSFEVQGNAFASMKTIQTHLGDIVRAIHQINNAAKKFSFNQTFRSMGLAHKQERGKRLSNLNLKR